MEVESVFCVEVALWLYCWPQGLGLVLAMPVKPLLCLSKRMEHITYLTAQISLVFFFPPQMLKYITVCRVMCPILRAEYDLGIFYTLRQNPCIVQSASMQCSTSFPLDTQPSIADKGFWRQI